MGRIAIAVLLFLLYPIATTAQDAPTTTQAQTLPASDSQAVAVLNQALAVGGVQTP